MTSAGQRGSRTAELITNIGAINQLQDDILELDGWQGELLNCLPKVGTSMTLKNAVLDDAELCAALRRINPSLVIYVRGYVVKCGACRSLTKNQGVYYYCG